MHLPNASDICTVPCRSAEFAYQAKKVVIQAESQMWKNSSNKDENVKLILSIKKEEEVV